MDWKINLQKRFCDYELCHGNSHVGTCPVIAGGFFSFEEIEAAVESALADQKRLILEKGEEIKKQIELVKKYGDKSAKAELLNPIVAIDDYMNSIKEMGTEKVKEK